MKRGGQVLLPLQGVAHMCWCAQSKTFPWGAPAVRVPGGEHLSWYSPTEFNLASDVNGFHSGRPMEAAWDLRASGDALPWQGFDPHARPFVPGASAAAAAPAQGAPQQLAGGSRVAAARDSASALVPAVAALFAAFGAGSSSGAAAAPTSPSAPPSWVGGPRALAAARLGTGQAPAAQEREEAWESAQRHAEETHRALLCAAQAHKALVAKLRAATAAGLSVGALRTRTNTNPYDTKANAAG